MHIVRIPTPDEGNPWYPLPANYFDLDGEDQRKARVNACRQWILLDDPAKQGWAFAECVDYFDRWYLWPEPELEFDPMFYDLPPRVAPPFHADLYRLWGSHQSGMAKATIAIAPRGGAKSFAAAKAIMLRAISHPMYSHVYATATHSLAQRMGDRIRFQLYNNQRIHDDWAQEPEFEGKIKPIRGDRPTGIFHMFLGNGSEIQLLSSKSRQRGIKPRRYVLDDPEYDPEASTPMEVLRQFIERLLFKVVLPAITRPETGVDWVGTFISKRHYLWHAMDTTETPDGPRAIDPRFDSWARLLIKGAKPGKDGKLLSCWPDMWPVDAAARAANPRLARTTTLEELETIMGKRVFRCEMMQEPDEEGGGFFPLSTKDDKKFGYKFERMDDPEVMATAPWKSDTVLKWHSRGSSCEAPLKQFLSKARVFVTCDTSYTTNTDSDYKVACCMALTQDNDLFILDLWAAQCHESKLVTEALKMADKWHAPTVHPEVVQRQISLYSSLDQAVRTRVNQTMGIGWAPAIRAIKPGATAKEAKIAVLAPRFEHGLIKFPLWRTMEMPWRMLFDQIVSFNPEVEGGGLKHDDCLDVVSMSQFVIRGLPVRAEKEPVAQPVNPIEELKKGKTHDDIGLPYIYGVDISTIPAEDVTEIISVLLQRKAEDKPRESLA